MIYSTLYYFILLLNDHLKLAFKLNEDIAFLCPIKEIGTQLPKNRVGVSLVNVERETAGGIQFTQQITNSNYSRMKTPVWQLNLYVLVSVIFPEKQYRESLQLLSGVLSFMQKNNLYDIQNTDTTVCIEPVNLSFQEQSNLWSINGGNYFPSILCKIRMLAIDEEEISGLSTLITSSDTDPIVKP